MSISSAILFHEILPAAERNPRECMVGAATNALFAVRDFGQKTTPEELTRVIGKVFSDLGNFPYDPKWVAEEAFRKYSKG